MSSRLDGPWGGGSSGSGSEGDENRAPHRRRSKYRALAGSGGPPCLAADGGDGDSDFGLSDRQLEEVGGDAQRRIQEARSIDGSCGWRSPASMNRFGWDVTGGGGKGFAIGTPAPVAPTASTCSSWSSWLSPMQRPRRASAPTPRSTASTLNGIFFDVCYDTGAANGSMIPGGQGGAADKGYAVSRPRGGADDGAGLGYSGSRTSPRPPGWGLSPGEEAEGQVQALGGGGQAGGGGPRFFPMTPGQNRGVESHHAGLGRLGTMGPGGFGSLADVVSLGGDGCYTPRSAPLVFPMTPGPEARRGGGPGGGAVGGGGAGGGGVPPGGGRSVLGCGRTSRNRSCERQCRLDDFCDEYEFVDDQEVRTDDTSIASRAAGGGVGAGGGGPFGVAAPGDRRPPGFGLLSASRGNTSGGGFSWL